MHVCLWKTFSNMQSSIMDGLIDTYMYTNISLRTCRHACEHTHKPTLSFANLRCTSETCARRCWCSNLAMCATDTWTKLLNQLWQVCFYLTPSFLAVQFLPCLCIFLLRLSLSLSPYSPSSPSSPSCPPPPSERQWSCRRLGGVCGCDRSQYSRRTDSKAPSWCAFTVLRLVGMWISLFLPPRARCLVSVNTILVN